MRSLRILLVSLVGLGLLAGTAGATGISSGYPYALQITIGGGTPIVLGDLAHSSTPTSDGTGWTYVMTAPTGNAFGQITSWNSTYNVDPQVSNNFTVVNTTAFDQIFTVSVTSPIAPVSPTSLMRGSIGLTVTDEGPLDGFGNTDGQAYAKSTLSTDVYRAFLDGSPVQSLMLDPFTNGCTPDNCSNTANADFGIPTRIPGPGAAFTMGITVQFLLSPGDAASVTSTFNIIPVPEPSTAVTLGLGLVALSIAGRRRSE